jgi:hypothetical protein
MLSRLHEPIATLLASDASIHALRGYPNEGRNLHFVELLRPMVNAVLVKSPHRLRPSERPPWGYVDDCSPDMRLEILWHVAVRARHEWALALRKFAAAGKLKRRYLRPCSFSRGLTRLCCCTKGCQGWKMVCDLACR